MSSSEKNVQNFSLLVDGKEAFPEILRCIEQAEKSIRINMFIWRDDTIGNRIASAVLAAAERGVQVDISVDRYGVVLEKTEECKKSFFHKQQSLTEKVKTAALELLYPMEGAPKRARDEETALYRAIMNHPNIRVERDKFKADHSKFYIFDDETLILGGVNIEDKENGCDMQGRVYQDYMVKLTGRAYVDAFLAKLERGEECGEGYSFGANVKEPQRRFEMERRYLELIRQAREELVITMAYFSPLPQFLEAIAAAYRRGVAVTVLVPERANFQSDTNRKTVKKLLKMSDNGITVYFSPKMVHTKLVANESWASFGSTNITKKAFRQLSELNLFLPRGSETAQQLMESVRENHALSCPVKDWRAVKYNGLLAWLEGFLV
ncbi:MAG: phosphatidylserine/phosphatidylglycerophosphate/cardiolipin synthase family protein [Ruminococcaceae bacterium]|nr:phosphatidylserine/phosphatidylglycerophosphate/cardiolipin synthase family protein [Oscillospiraceae bacterium]